MRKLIAVAALALAAVACSDPVRVITPRAGGTEPTTSPPASPSPSSAPATTQVTLYYLSSGANEVFLVPERHRVAATPAIARAALEELVHGQAQDPDHSTPFPDDSKINSVTISSGLATVDWSAEVLEASVGAEVESRGIQSIVYTLTEFSSVQKVRFTVEGKTSGTASNGRAIEDFWGHVGLSDQPWDRDDPLDVLAPITLWTPLQGTSSSGSLSLTGEGTTFEANVGIRLYDAAGKLVYQGHATAFPGPPERGEFSATIPFTAPSSPQTWTLAVTETSAMDGAVVYQETRTIRVG